jgi:hypothetical protein
MYALIAIPDEHASKEANLLRRRGRTGWLASILHAATAFLSPIRSHFQLCALGGPSSMQQCSGL